MDNVLFLPSDILLCADECLDAQIHQKLFEGFAYGKCRVRFEKGTKGMLCFDTCEPYGYTEVGWRTAQITLGSEKEC